MPSERALHPGLQQQKPWHMRCDKHLPVTCYPLVCNAGMMWGSPWLWLPSRHFTEWALRPAHNARVAIINAVYTVGGHVHRMLPIMLAQFLSEDRYSLLIALLLAAQVCWQRA